MEEGVSVKLREGGRGGVKCWGEVGLCAQSRVLEIPVAEDVPMGVLTPVLLWLCGGVLVGITVPCSGSGASGTVGRVIAKASRIMECRRRSWEDMKGAEWRSPVQRVMSMQSRD